MLRLAVYIIPLGAFIALASLVVTGASASFDVSLMAAARDLHAAWLTPLMQAVSHVGSTWGIAALSALLVAALLRRGERRTALVLVLAVLGAALVVVLTKLAFGRPRPELFAWLDHPGGKSFPSGHALSGILFFPLAAAITRQTFAWPRWTVGAELAFGVLVGLSRPYLGVHWPTDVLAGFALGLALLLVALRVLAPDTRPAGKDTATPP